MWFQSTLPRRERPEGYPQALDISPVSIHAPTKGATIRNRAAGAGITVSIHAPTKGATRRYILLRSAEIVSIHAPTKGATTTAYLFITSSMFQSTLPRRERPIYFIASPVSATVSIHAPTKGATLRETDWNNANTKVSIHAPTKGATLTSASLFFRGLFQSTLPRRERLIDYTQVICSM